LKRLAANVPMTLKMQSYGGSCGDATAALHCTATALRHCRVYIRASTPEAQTIAAQDLSVEGGGRTPLA
jgi:hypothetical protein